MQVSVIRRSALLAFSVALGLSGVSATAQAAVEAGSPPSATGSSAGAVSQAGEADSARSAQRRVDFIEQAKRTLGKQYGGTWVDPDDEERLKLALVAEPGTNASPEAREHARDLIAQAELTGRVDVVTSPRSEAEITRLYEQLAPRLQAANDSAATTVDAGVDVTTGTVRLEVPTALTRAQQAFVDSALQPGVTRVAKDEGRLQLDSCTSGGYCDPPLRGGIRINNGGGACTAGFVVRSLSNSVRYLTTAAHCIDEGGSDTWSTRFTDGSIHNIGALHNRNNELAILKIANPDGWRPGPYIRLLTNNRYTIRDDSASPLNQSVSMSGFSSGGDSGKVVTAYGTWYGVPNSYMATYCGSRGDSGGPVFWNGIAYGSHSGTVFYSNGTCRGIYVSVKYFDNLLNVVPLFG